MHDNLYGVLPSRISLNDRGPFSRKQRSKHETEVVSLVLESESEILLLFIDDHMCFWSGPSFFSVLFSNWNRSYCGY